MGNKVQLAAKPTPKSEGFWWAKWRIKAEGTADENDPPGDEWEVMHVVINDHQADDSDPEKYMVMVPGVERWQPLENFFWGKQVEIPEAYQ